MPREDRSRSPYRGSIGDSKKRKREDSHSPTRHHHHYHRSKHAHKHSVVKDAPSLRLPFNARSLSRHDLPAFNQLFGTYLDIQKNLDIEVLEEDEVKGRWKSFIGKWNRGELAEGWYDPKTLEKAHVAEPRTRASPDYNGPSTKLGKTRTDLDEDEDDDDYGPALPGQEHRRRQDDPATPDLPTLGPTAPKMADLQLRRELNAEETVSTRRQASQARHLDRKAEHTLRKERLDELAPKAEAGTRERQLEKRREIASSNRTFASSKDAGDIEIPEADVMGGGDELAELKRLKEEESGKKSERETRREEVARARKAEREERVKGMKEKEEKTMEMLREIARARFGAEGGGKDGLGSG